MENQSNINDQLIPSFSDKMETGLDRTWRKMKSNPILTVGVLSGIGILTYSIYGFKTRKVSASIYAVQTRVAVQGMVVGCLALGMIMNMYNEHWKTK